MAEIKNIEISKETPDSLPEKYQEKETKVVKSAGSSTTNKVLPVNLPSPQAQTQAPETAIILEKVENILAKNLDRVFLSMDAAQQARFKAKGEATAQEITGLFQKGKSTAKNIINLIIDWLRVIPRVNKHFLEQEAKIKTDAILKIYNRQ